MSNSAAPSEKPSKKQVFFARTFSTLILWGFVIGALIVGNELLFFILIAGLGTLALWEFLTMLGHKGNPAKATRIFVTICSIVYVCVLFYRPDVDDSEGMAMLLAPLHFDGLALVVVIFGTFVVALFGEVDTRNAFERVVGPVFGFVYVVILFNFLTRILEAGVPSAHLYIFLGLIVTKFTDMGAYITGSLIGKTKMIPHVSPGKTWEGIAGAFVFAQIGGFVVWLIFKDDLSWLAWSDVLVLGIILPIAAVIGDLAESVLKRSLGCKDSGRMLPGIGGALDLIDSILFTAPILYFFAIL